MKWIAAKFAVAVALLLFVAAMALLKVWLAVWVARRLGWL